MFRLAQRRVVVRNTNPIIMARRRQPSTGRIEASQRAIAILDAIAEAGEVGTNELARLTGLPPSTVSRQLGTLASAGLVEQDAGSGRYRLGIHVVRLANAVLARLDVRRVARPHLEDLVRITGETATLHVPGDEDAVTVDFVPSAHFVQHVSQLGRPSIAHATSAGKVMLAFTERPLPRGPLRAYTPRTITTVPELTAEIERVRRQGYAEALEEREPGLAAVAAPVWSSTGALAAIVALQGPTARFRRAEVRAAVAPLLERARMISAALGATDSTAPQHEPRAVGRP
jgi:DNA-binding IclR family transcriptional regulator